MATGKEFGSDSSLDEYLTELPEEVDVLKDKVEGGVEVSEKLQTDEHLSELKDEVGILKDRVETLETDTEALKQFQIEQRSEEAKGGDSFVTKEIRMKEGFRQFVLKKKLKNPAKAYSNYSDWYNDIAQEMQNGKLYNCDDYVFFSKSTFSEDREKQINFMHTPYIKKEGSSIIFDMNRKPWAQHTIEFVVILHPNDESNPKQMDKGRKSFVTQEQKNKWKFKDITGEFYSDQHELIVCALKKKSKWEKVRKHFFSR